MNLYQRFYFDSNNDMFPLISTVLIIFNQRISCAFTNDLNFPTTILSGLYQRFTMVYTNDFKLSLPTMSFYQRFITIYHPFWAAFSGFQIVGTKRKKSLG